MIQSLERVAYVLRDQGPNLEVLEFADILCNI